MNKKIIIITLLILLPAIVGLVLKAVYTSSVVIDGKSLHLVNSKIYEIKMENSQLELQLAKLGSINLVAEKAENLGMSPTTISFISLDEPKLASGQ